MESRFNKGGKEKEYFKGKISMDSRAVSYCLMKSKEGYKHA